MDRMTEDLLRSALATAEEHHRGLLALRDRLKSTAIGGAAPWDAEAAAGQLVRTLRWRLDEIEAQQAADAKLDEELHELGIDPADFDDEDDALPDWPVLADQMLSTPGSLTALLYPKPGCCYLTSSGVAVHVRPSCRCPR